MGGLLYYPTIPDGAREIVLSASGKLASSSLAQEGTTQ
jgi:hypothetical protein